MFDTRHLQPPGSGLGSDPILFGVADALARLFPVEEAHNRHEVASSVEISPVEDDPAHADAIAA